MIYNYLYLILITNFLILTIAFSLNLKLKNAGIVDVIWPLLFISNIGIITKTNPNLSLYQLVFLFIIFLTNLRLFIYLLIRFIKHHPNEDTRYTNFKSSFQKFPNLAIFFIYQFQGIFAAILFIPLIPALLTNKNTLGAIEILGIFVYLIALLGEFYADKQLSDFKSKNNDSLCNSGLWKYSRHPNYFFEWLNWVSYFIYGLNGNNGWLCIIPSLTMLILLTKITGIKPSEELMLKKRGKIYETYIKTTSAFIPFPPKSL